MPANTDVILCFCCGKRPSVAYHKFFWNIESSAKAGFLCCGHCLNEDLKREIFSHSAEDVAAFQCFLDECFEESGGKFDIIPVGRTYEGMIGWFSNLKVDSGATLH